MNESVGQAGQQAGQVEEQLDGQPAYAPRDVSRLFDLPESRLRYWAQTGFIRPSIRVRGRTYYSFRDLIAIKVARELMAAGLPLQRVRKSLDALRVKLPEVDQPLSKLRVRCEHEQVVVEDSARSFEAATGQVLLDLSVQTLKTEVAQVLAMPRSEEQQVERSAYEWFLFACEREAAWDGEDPDDQACVEAREAYDRALDLDPEFAAAYTNLGALLAAIGDIDGARDHFDQALRCDPGQLEAQANLAALALRVGDIETAIAGYRQLLRASPDSLEGHYGLARALLAVGGKGQALAHLERFVAAVDRLAPAQRDTSLKDRRQHASRVIASLRRELQQSG